MLRFIKILLAGMVITALAWLLPWCLRFAMPDTQRVPFTMFSEVLGQFVMSGSDDKKGFFMTDEAGNVYTKEQADSILPSFYYRQLMSDGRLPDSLNGKEMSPKAIQMSSFIFRVSPSQVNVRMPRLYPLLESMSGRVDLEMPDDVFRMTDKGVEFVDMATNTVDAEKSAAFTGAMLKKGFRFPAREVSGNPTTRKEYDNGYMVIDAGGRVFRLMMVKGRPFVRDTGIPDSLGIRHAFVTELRSRDSFGFLTDRDNRLYVLKKDYSLVEIPVDGFNPEKEELMIIANMFVWTVQVSGDNGSKWYGVDADSLRLISSREIVYGQSAAGRVSRYLFPFTVSFTSPDDCFADLRISGVSFEALYLNAVLAGAYVFIRRRKRSALKNVCGAACCLVFGIYGLLALMFTGYR